MLSTFHDDNSIDPALLELKPYIITFYNIIEGVDVADRTKSEYSVTRVSIRYSFTLFCSMINIANYKLTNKLTSKKNFMFLAKKFTIHTIFVEPRRLIYQVLLDNNWGVANIDPKKYSV